MRERCPQLFLEASRLNRALASLERRAMDGRREGGREGGGSRGRGRGSGRAGILAVQGRHRRDSRFNRCLTGGEPSLESFSFRLRVAKGSWKGSCRPRRDRAKIFQGARHIVTAKTSRRSLACRRWLVAGLCLPPTHPFGDRAAPHPHPPERFPFEQKFFSLYVLST